MTSGSDCYDSRTDLDVNALSSSQMMCGDFAGAKLRFFEQMVQKFVINCFIGRQGFTPPA